MPMFLAKSENYTISHICVLIIINECCPLNIHITQNVQLNEKNKVLSRMQRSAWRKKISMCLKHHKNDCRL